MSTVRWNLKESYGKILVWGIRTTYEAVKNGRVCLTKQSPKLSEFLIVNVADIWDEGYGSYPGRSDRYIINKDAFLKW